MHSIAQQDFVLFYLEPYLLVYLSWFIYQYFLGLMLHYSCIYMHNTAQNMVVGFVLLHLEPWMLL